MSDSQQSKDIHVGMGLMEFSMRFCTHMMNRDQMSSEEASAFMAGVSNALDTGRLTAGLSDAYAAAKARLRGDDIVFTS